MNNLTKNNPALILPNVQAANQDTQMIVLAYNVQDPTMIAAFVWTEDLEACGFQSVGLEDYDIEDLVLGGVQDGEDLDGWNVSLL